MKIIDTSQLPDDLSPSEVYWVYNGLDCCLTYEIRDKLAGYLDDTAKATYQRSLDIQAPYLEMMLRGVRRDATHVKQKLAECDATIARLERILERLCVDGLGLPTSFNWRSHTQVKTFFYGVLGLKEIKKRNQQGFYAAASDRETLEKLGSLYFVAEPFTNLILALRDQGKMRGFLSTPADKDGRIRCNFNITGTNTGRLSSSFSDFGTGTNLQNVDRNLRYTFIPDAGKVFVNIDLEQADSRGVGALSWQAFYDYEAKDIKRLMGLSHWDGPIGPEFAGRYLDACESGDLHTAVCVMGWPELSWTDDLKANRKVAEQNAYRTFTYRDMAKKLGHGTNYLGQPKTMAMHTKVPVAQIELFQDKYFGGFPCVKAWQLHTINQVKTTGQLTHLFGRRRFFFGRHEDQTTLNAAIAYCPQGMTGDAINIGVLNLWRDPRFELLIQVHDSILFQIDEDKMDELVPLALELLKAPLTLKGGREFCIPVEAKVGWNWGDFDYDDEDRNPYGLKVWKGKETRIPPKYLSRPTLIKPQQKEFWEIL